MATEAARCPLWLQPGEGLLPVRCERSEGHRGKHRKYSETGIQGKNVSMLVEWEDFVLRMTLVIVLPEEAAKFSVNRIT